MNSKMQKAVHKTIRYSRMENLRVKYQLTSDQQQSSTDR